MWAIASLITGIVAGILLSGPVLKLGARADATRLAAAENVAGRVLFPVLMLAAGVLVGRFYGGILGAAVIVPTAVVLGVTARAVRQGLCPDWRIIPFSSVAAGVLMVAAAEGLLGLLGTGRLGFVDAGLAARLAGNRSIEVLSALMRNGPPQQRAGAIEQLVTIHGPAAVPAFSDALRHESEEVRLAAIDGLARIGTPASGQVIGQARDDASPRVREQARAVLIRLKDPQVLSIAVAEGSGKFDEREIRSLTRQMGAVAIPELRKMLAADSVDVRRTAIRLLGECNDAAAADTLLEAVRSRDAGTRVAALEALAQFTGEVRKSHGRVVINSLRGSTQSSAAEQWSAGIDVARLMSVLSEATGDRDPAVRAAAGVAVCKVVGLRILWVGERLDAYDPKHGLKGIELAKVAPLLHKLILSSNPTVATEAQVALYAVGEAHPGILRPLLRHPNPSIWKQTAERLGRSGNRSFVPAVRAIHGRYAGRGWCAVCYSLSLLGEPLNRTPHPFDAGQPDAPAWMRMMRRLEGQ